MAEGCSLHEKSRGNFTVKCKGHPEYHRSRAIATLQFNCHLAFLVVLIVGFYSFFCSTFGVGRDYMNYKPLNAELQQLGNQNQFTLNYEEDDDDDDEIAVEENLQKQKTVVNGLGTH
ncbi:Protein of unknown function DUF716 [Macleaya cordata]|uniref:Transmembrane protein n=1 Tax=Macleaya cordata TaxID=56857 RepID=A0A200R0J8_MACCD|nr:Protein of unknown function DUF716 [Macleaya cordata]